MFSYKEACQILPADIQVLKEGDVADMHVLIEGGVADFSSRQTRD